MFKRTVNANKMEISSVRRLLSQNVSHSSWYKGRRAVQIKQRGQAGHMESEESHGERTLNCMGM